jgi:predicted nucleic acid-binding Zn ribbon protein
MRSRILVNLPGGGQGVMAEGKKTAEHEEIIKEMNEGLEKNRRERAKRKKLAMRIGMLLAALLVLMVSIGLLILNN